MKLDIHKYMTVNEKHQKIIDSLEKDLESLNNKVKIVFNGCLGGCEEIEKDYCYVGVKDYTRYFNKEIIGSKEDIERIDNIRHKIFINTLKGRKNYEEFIEDFSIEYNLSLNDTKTLLYNTSKLADTVLENVTKTTIKYNISKIENIHKKTVHFKEIEYQYKLMDSFYNIFGLDNK